MRLGLNLGYWGTTGTDNLASMVALAQEADRQRYAVAWLAEAYGSDIPSLTGYLAAHTTTLGWGSAIMQIPARTPAMTAMTAATLDRITDGRFHLGLGVSGPQVSEGWHGVRFDDPLGRTREYVEIIRLAFARKNVVHDGTHFQLPLPDGPGKALRLLLLPQRPNVPIYLASIGPRNLRLTGEIADGWLGIFVSPEYADEQLAQLRAGRARAMENAKSAPDAAPPSLGAASRASHSGDDGGDVDGVAGSSHIVDESDLLDGFDVAASVAVSVHDDLDAAADRLRDNAALYVGGMGSRSKNFYNALAARMGFEQEAARVQDLYLDRKHREAALAVPRDFIDQTALIGPRERIAERLHRYAAAGVTTLNLAPVGETLEQRLETIALMRSVLDDEGLGD